MHPPRCWHSLITPRSLSKIYILSRAWNHHFPRLPTYFYRLAHPLTFLWGGHVAPNTIRDPLIEMFYFGTHPIAACGAVKLIECSWTEKGRLISSGIFVNKGNSIGMRLSAHIREFMIKITSITRALQSSVLITFSNHFQN